MIVRREFIVLSAAAAAVVPVRAAVAAGTTFRRGEVRSFREFAEKTHPRGREAAASEPWRSRWAALEGAADRLPDGAYYIGLRRALGWFEDGHTTVLPFEFTGGVPTELSGGPFGQNLPLNVRVFSNGAFVTATDASGRALLGKQVQQVGALPVAELIRAHASQWPGNMAWAQRWAGPLFASPALLQGIGAISDPMRPVAMVAGGTTASLSPIAGPLASPATIDRTPSARESWAKEAGGGNYARPIPQHNALYVSIDDMDDVEGKTFEQLTRDTFAAMAAPAVDRVIIDLRRNGGGNNFWGEPIRKGLEASRFNRPGGLYVLISPMTFSAAQNLANRLERETFAIFVGEPTGGAPNHYGDAKIMRGGATGITAMVSTLPWFDSYPQDKRPWILPDLPVPATFADWRAGRDMALDVALAHRTDAEPDFLGRDQVFYYGRATQKAGWKPFWS